MTTTDSNGIIRFQETDLIGPEFSTVLNSTIISISNAITALKASSTVSIPAYTGPNAAGFTSSSVTARKEGKHVYLNGSFGGAPDATFGAIAGQLPSGYRPAESFKMLVGSSAVNAVNTNGRWIGVNASDGYIWILQSGSFAGGTWLASSGGSGLMLSNVSFMVP